MLGIIPEALEAVPQQCLQERTEALAGFRSLGPPDMVQLVKKAAKSKFSSTYHYVTGVDVSSAAAIAAHLTTLTGSLGEMQLWFGKAPQWRVTEGTYCSWNAFSKFDIRVTAAFLGSTTLRIVTPDGLVEESGGDFDVEIWRELYMSAMIRCLLLKDDDRYYMHLTRHEFPFDADGCMTFLEAFESLYYRGPLVGSGPWVQHPSLDCNYMVDALYTFLDVTGKYEDAIKMLGRLDAKEVMAHVLLLANQEVNAVGLLVNTVRKEPRNACMLATEAEFCLSKNQLELALDCALRAVNSAPADFYPWEILCKVYIALGEWEQALLALNSTPLIPQPPMDAVRMSEPKKVHVPVPEDGVLEEAWQANAGDSVTARAMYVDPALLRLPAANFKGCTTRAYSILATVNARIGWSELMKLRGKAFWMTTEDEQNDIEAETGDETKTENGVEQTETEPEAQANGGVDRSEPTEGEQTNEQTDNGKTVVTEAAAEQLENEIEQPQKTETVAETTSETTEAVAAANQRGPCQTLRSKRLCERRIDRLFMAQFEDVTAYSSWQRQFIHQQTQNLPFDKSASQWYLFGACAQRLKHDEQARRAYNAALSMAFNHNALIKALELDPLNLDNVVKLCAWYHRWYTEFSPRVMSLLRKIVARDGLTKVKVEIEARFNKEKVVGLMQIMLSRLQKLQVKGYDM